ncbi:MAG: SRPBCC family protein [Gammaproteobacteria bacterium]|nr:SRPBCC family protein [Gammaproteobacteria bacterium]MDH5803183.1 SRPBCC family protein [Gammaproteobacteria bacterium]
MPSYKREIIIHTTPELLFDYVTEQSNLPAWSPQVVRSEVEGGGPLKIGSMLIQTRKQGNRVMTSRAEVIKHDRPALHAVTTGMLGVVATFSFAFENHAGATRGTKISMTGEVKGKGLGVFVAPLLKMAMEKGDDKVLENLKRVIECK